MIEVRWHGRGGQGAFTASKILGSAALKEGQYALAFPSFGPERRGAPVQAFTKISRVPIGDRSVIKKCDYMIFLDETLFTKATLDELKPQGKIIINTSHAKSYEGNKEIITLPASKLAEEILHKPIVNTALLGALSAGMGYSWKERIEAALEEFLPDQRLLSQNKAVLERAYTWIGEGSK